MDAPQLGDLALVIMVLATGLKADDVGELNQRVRLCGNQMMRRHNPSKNDRRGRERVMPKHILRDRGTAQLRIVI
jgi:hypothetical protein